MKEIGIVNSLEELQKNENEKISVHAYCLLNAYFNVQPKTDELVPTPEFNTNNAPNNG